MPLSTIQPASFHCNGRAYRVAPRPVVVVCFDGCSDEYLDAAFAAGRMPRTLEMSVRGYRGMVRGALPSFTNVNNASIVTGVPPSVTGISGNFFYDTQTGTEVMMNDARYLRCGTILAAAAQAGRRVAMVTAKEKLRDILSKDLAGIAFSSEKAAAARSATHGIDNVEAIVGARTPPIYSAEASLFVLRAGAALIERGLADFLYLSLTDYIQHMHAPCDEQALDFYQQVDTCFGRLLEHGALLAVTADHGMNAKCTWHGEPHVIYLESLLARQFGGDCRIVLPITDPYVLHHGALGSYASIHCSQTDRIAEMAAWILQLPGITEVYDRQTAAAKLELPTDRIGDLIVLSGRDVAIGKTPEHHDLQQLAGRLRSHGGRYEELVPMLLSVPLNAEYHLKAQADPRNFDIFDFACNGAEQ